MPEYRNLKMTTTINTNITNTTPQLLLFSFPFFFSSSFYSLLFLLLLLRIFMD
jgi:hypothetical protein